MKAWLKHAILLICISYMIYRSVYSNYLLGGTHDDMYYLFLYNSHEAIYNLIIGVLLVGYLQVNKQYSNLIIKFTIAFCFTIFVYMNYGFLGQPIIKHIKYFTVPFYSVFGIIGILLIIYFIYHFRSKEL